MRVAALYDIHGNPFALEAVLEEVAAAKVDRIVVGGDIAWGAFPHETVSRLMELADDTVFIRGNGDREVAAGLDEPDSDLTGWSARQLNTQERELLNSFQPTAVIDIDGLGPTLFCHASPRSDDEIISPVTDEQIVAEVLAGIEQRVVIAGHTHVQNDRVVNGVRFVQAGSIGMPHEGPAGAYWALLGPDVSLRRTRYDVEDAAVAIRNSGMPHAADFAKELITPYSRDEAISHLETLAGR